MYPGIKHETVQDQASINTNFDECMNILHINPYCCQLKMDYANERQVLQESKEKKRGWREVIIPTTNITPAFNWEYIFNYRLRTNITDSLAINADIQSSCSSLDSRMYISVFNQTTNKAISLLNENAIKITKNMVSYRKKTKNCYSKKMPTPLDFWESEFKNTYKFKEETSPSSIALCKQINDFIDQCFQVYGNELANGSIPDKVSSGIEFYLNYILHVIHIQISDTDIKNSIASHTNAIDGLSEHSIGKIMSAMRLLLFKLYNKQNGILYPETEYVYSYFLSDIQSFTHILIDRFCKEFPRLTEPVFSQLVQSVVANAVFIQASPLFQDIALITNHIERDAFVSTLTAYLNSTPNAFDVLPYFLDEEDETLTSIVNAIDGFDMITAPLQKVRSMTNVMNNLYQYAVKHVQEEGIEMDPSVMMNKISTFMILMNSESFVPNIRYLLAYCECTPLTAMNNSTITYLLQAYTEMRKELGIPL